MLLTVLTICSLLVLLMSWKGGFGENVFASSAQLRMLEEREKNLIDAVKVYIRNEQKKLQSIEGSIAQIESSRTAAAAEAEEATGSMKHPIEVFHLIHRFTTIWNRLLSSIIPQDVPLEEIKLQFQLMIQFLPTADDYDGARAAIIRLQHAYDLSISDLVNGTILGHSSRPMSQQMAVDVSLYALSRKLLDDALLWLTHAQDHRVPPLVPVQDIYYAAARIYAQKGQLLQSVDFIKKALEVDPTNSRYLSHILPNETDVESKWPVSDDKYYRLCREFIHDLQKRNSSGTQLGCEYETGIVPFKRKKVEYLHRSPDVVLYHNFVTDQEAAQLQLMAKFKIEMAMIGDSRNRQVSEQRVGKTAWLFDNSGEPVIDRISRRVTEFTGLETRSPFAEPLQLANYGLAGHYYFHYDHDPNRYDRTDLPVETLMSGDRIATFMIYLSHVEAGGATIFPEIDLGTRPVKNAALFWYNYKRSGMSESKSLHAGCPVLIGEKWIANKWIREFGQLFRRRCELTMDE